MFATILHHITNAASSNYHYTNQRPPLFYNALKSLFIHSEVWGQFLGSDLRVSQCIYYRFGFPYGLLCSCIFHPCDFDRIAFSTPAFSVAPPKVVASEPMQAVRVIWWLGVGRRVWRSGTAGDYLPVFGSMWNGGIPMCAGGGWSTEYMNRPGLVEYALHVYTHTHTHTHTHTLIIIIVIIRHNNYLVTYSTLFINADASAKYRQCCHVLPVAVVILNILA